MKKQMISNKFKLFLSYFVPLLISTACISIFIFSSLSTQQKGQILTIFNTANKPDSTFSIGSSDLSGMSNEVFGEGLMTGTQIQMGLWYFQPRDGYILLHIYGLVFGLLSFAVFLFWVLRGWKNKQNVHLMIG